MQVSAPVRGVARYPTRRLPGLRGPWPRPRATFPAIRCWRPALVPA